jgi:uracil-DNA glycosylase
MTSTTIQIDEPQNNGSSFCGSYKKSFYEVAKSKEQLLSTWMPVFEDAKPELDLLNKVIQKKFPNEILFPQEEYLYRAFELTPLDKVKIVIIGQDPYHQMILVDDKYVPRAQGLAFSVSREDVVPQSLMNIFKELSSCGYKTRCRTGDLTGWAEQGVLLLNTALCVVKDKAGSCGKLWIGFIKKVIKKICETNVTCIFMLWGKEAQILKDFIASSCIVLETSHPSGFSARYGFLGCGHFKTANEMLVKENKVPVEW